MLKIYLDNCCYNRPYDDQSYANVFLETQAKLYIQELIREGKVKMFSFYILMYENSRNPFTNRRISIANFLKNAVGVVDIDKSEEVVSLATKIKATGIKSKDSLHIASAIIAECDYFITTDYRLLKYHTEKIKMKSPAEFITEYGILSLKGGNI